MLLASTISAAKLSEAQAIPVASGFGELDAVDSERSNRGSERIFARIEALGSTRKSVLGSGNFIVCDTDARGCSPISDIGRGTTTGAVIAANAALSPASSRGGDMDLLDPTVLLLLIVGLIGISRLRGTPVE